MNNIIALTGASLVAVLGDESAFAISAHDRDDIRTFTFLPREISQVSVARMLLVALDTDGERLRHITVTAAPTHTAIPFNFVATCNHAIVMIASATGAAVTEVSHLTARALSVEPGATAADIAVAVEKRRRECFARGQPFGETLIEMDKERQRNTEVLTLRGSLEDAR